MSRCKRKLRKIIAQIIVAFGNCRAHIRQINGAQNAPAENGRERMDEATTKRLQEALRDCKKAARAISAAIDSHETDHARIEYHRNDAIAQLEFALSALRATKS